MRARMTSLQAGGLAGMQDSSVASVLPHLALTYSTSCTAVYRSVHWHSGLAWCGRDGRMGGLWHELSSVHWKRLYLAL